MDVTQPEFAFISVGNNNYGHPNPEVTERLLNEGTNVYVSAIHKDVTFYFDATKIKGVKCTNPPIEEGIY